MLGRTFFVWRSCDTSYLLLGRVATIAMLLAAVGPWPYDSFTLMRFAVCAVTTFGAYQAYKNTRAAVTAPQRTRQQVWAWAFALIAFLFNPLIPVHLTRATWTVIDIGVALVILADIPGDLRVRRRPGNDPH